MREIKFRVWDYHSNKYINDYITGTSLSLNDLFKNGSRVNGKNSLVFEQYAGLKDCNGVEIYEGDILRDNRFGYVAKVFYDERNACFETMDINENVEIFEVWVICEVIGNIHENQELLENK